MDCKREFYKFNHILRVLELIWIHSIFSSKSNSNLFTIFISISILQEDRQKILSYDNQEDLHKYFFSKSSSSISQRSTKTILQRAHIYYQNYISAK